MSHYADGDKIFLFGFSRGAYTLRLVASLLHMFGVFREGVEHVVPYAIKFAKSDLLRDDSVQWFKSAEMFRAAFSRCECHVHFFGMWDSVGSIGAPFSNPVGMPYIGHNPSIRIGRHAVAIDERRAFFRTELWGPQDSDIKQVWFPGAHSDIGGGYPEAESGLSKITLRWMIKEAVANGLLLDRNRAKIILGMHNDGYAPPNPRATIHRSLVGFWKFAEFLPKRYWSLKRGRHVWRINDFRYRTIPVRSLVHESAYQRGDGYAQRLPPDAIVVTDIDGPYLVLEPDS